MMRRLQLLGGIGVAVLLATSAGTVSAAAQSAKADALHVRVLSSRPDMVTGGDALVRIELPAGVTAADVKLTVNGAAATAKLEADTSGRSLTGLVTGLANGSNTLTATAAKKGTAKLTVVNHP